MIPHPDHDPPRRHRRRKPLKIGIRDDAVAALAGVITAKEGWGHHYAAHSSAPTPPNRNHNQDDQRASNCDILRCNPELEWQVRKRHTAAVP